VIKLLKSIGPGIVVAATGIGAGDMIAATVGGAKYGYMIIWAVILGGILKYVLNEGVGRWQLKTKTTLTDGWIKHLPKFFSWYFIVYLLLWSFVVFGALMAATGLAAHALTGIFNVKIWAAIHSALTIIIVLAGSYKHFENIMKLLISLMFLVVLVSSFLLEADVGLIFNSIINPTLPEGSVKYALAIIGGVGGSVTILSYGYWIKEKNWAGKKFLPKMKLDLAIAYILTTIFGISIITISADLKPEIVNGSGIVIGLADKFGELIGNAGRWIFLFGFWGAVFSSMIGVWQGVPYIFADFVNTYFKDDREKSDLKNTKEYKVFMILMATLPFVLLLLGKPVWLIVLYSVIGSLFMPFLAFTLLWLNNSKTLMKSKKNTVLVNVFLIINLLLFLYLGIIEILKYL